MNSVDKAAPAGFLVRHPWLFVVLAFGLLITAWTALITVAVKHAPQQVEVNIK
jgi:hypothetical protein